MESRKLKFVPTAAIIVAIFGIAILAFARHSLINPAHVAAAQSTIAAQAPVQTQPVAATAQPTAEQLPPGTIKYEAKAVTTAQFLARQHLTESKYMTVAEYVAAIGQANSGKTSFKRGDTVLIPGIESQPVVEKSRPYPKEEEIRAVYMTGTTAGSVKGLELAKRWKEAGGNAVVFDIKDSDGSISIPFDHPLAKKTVHHSISNLPKYVRYLHSLDLHVIARQALFRDDNIAQNHSTLAVQSRSMHQPWRENGKLVWTDSSNKEVQDYNIALAKYVASCGVDEIQFDYVRFPAEGNQADAEFAFQKDPNVHRDDVIASFLERAYAQLHPTGVLMSLDVFGVMAWQRQVDLSHTGQDIVKMAKHADVISPMIYPSHFFGMDGYANPGDAPEHFIGTSMDRFVKVTAGSGVVLRPWLQAFHWRTKTYSPEYILTQVSTSKKHGGDGFLFWNAANDYSKPFTAMPVMMGNPKTYLKTPDDVPVTQTASATMPNGMQSAAAQGHAAHAAKVGKAAQSGVASHASENGGAASSAAAAKHQ
ncbi:MAG TPA: putative glycoside hydrolase [Candidatus Limnocylindrales bacterium]|nr:putative glycoside hydrolase [Candidatus Limnocylindrales bacterium]